MKADREGERRHKLELRYSRSEGFHLNRELFDRRPNHPSYGSGVIPSVGVFICKKSSASIGGRTLEIKQSLSVDLPWSTWAMTDKHLKRSKNLRLKGWSLPDYHHNPPHNSIALPENRIQSAVRTESGPACPWQHGAHRR